MARDIEVRLNYAGGRAILTSAGVLGDLMGRGEAMADSASSKASPDDMDNAPFTALDDSGSDRARVRVVASSPHGKRHNNKYNTLLKSLDAGR